MDHLNVFYPYKDKPLHHEDQLTRALLILAKKIKIIESVFIDMIINKMKNNNCQLIPNRLFEGEAGIVEIQTQVWSSTKNEITSKGGRLISILITDERLKLTHRIERTDRVGVYDGIFLYKPDWIFVLENKPDYRNVWLEQLSSNFSDRLDIEEKPVLLTWQEIISTISTANENGLLQNSESLLVEDFLDFVVNQFPEINPFDRFEVCKNNQYLLNRRCHQLMEESRLGPVEYHRGWCYHVKADDGAAKQIALYAQPSQDNSWEIILVLYPGDTMSQARHFYSNVNIDSVMNLEKLGWKIKPNFHFSFRSSNLVYTNTTCSISEYFNYWLNQVKEGVLGQVKRNQWEEVIQRLFAAKIFSEQDNVLFNEKIRSTNMDRINICPGVQFLFRWSQDEAIRLDNKKAFIGEFKKRVAECLDTWNKLTT